nr:FAD:protein FMN transferase [uncultured Desulfobulbus sp.]
MSETGFNRQYIGRRKFLQILAVAGAAGALYGYGVLRAEKPAQVVRQSRSLMGTQINLIAYGPDEDQCLRAIHDTFSRMETLEGVFSRYLPESAVSLLNAQGHLEVAPEDLMQVLNLAETISQATEGAFDVSVLPLLRLYDQGQLPSAGKIAEVLPLVDYQRIKREGQGVYFSRKGMGVTFDGIAKGYIVDQGVDALQKAGFANVYVEAGGDLMVSGTKPAHLPWRIGVQNPRAESTQAMTVLELGKPLAVATSGDYMQPFSKDLRNHHILDPRKGLSPPELASATVTAPSVALADGLATAAMVLGHAQAIALLQQFDDCEGLFIDKQLNTFKTSGFQG